MTVIMKKMIRLFAQIVIMECLLRKLLLFSIFTWNQFTAPRTTGVNQKKKKLVKLRHKFIFTFRKCSGCAKAITDNYISALDGQWCPNCFVCATCGQPFADGNFFEHEGKPYCETHFHALKGSLCAGCSKPISGRCITAMFRKFHPEHFVCSFCLKQLNMGTFKEKGEKPYCHECFNRLFG